MRKRICYLLTFVFILCLFLNYNKEYDNAAQKNDKQKFVVGFDAEFPPYGYKDDNGEYVGFDLDLAQEVCNRNGWELVKQPVDWESKDMELNTGAISCIWNGFTMNGREGDYTWSSPYVDNSQVVIVKKDSGIKKLSDLKNKIVAVQMDSSALAALTGDDATKENKKLCKSFKDLQQIADYNNAFMNLEIGSVDAVCLDIGVANYQVEKRGDEFVALDEHVSTEQYGVGFKKGNKELRDTVQKTLIEMVKDGKFAEIAEKWELSDCVCLTENSVVKDVQKTSSDSNKNSKKDKTFTEKMSDILKQLPPAIGSSVLIFILTLVFSLPLGLGVAFVRMSKIAPLRWLAKIYISIMRGTPLMLQLFIVYYGPSYIFGITVSGSYRFIAVIIGFALNYAAYFAEIYRSGIESIPDGQKEAATVLGYSHSQIFGRIIFPQMVKRVLPPITNEVITLVKDTSLAFVLAYAEMFTVAKQIAAAQASVMALFVAGVFYYVFNFVIAMFMEWIEKKMSYYND